MAKKAILDLDIGVDDTMALMEALENPELDVIGVTTVFGNVPQATSERNALDLTEMLGHPEVKVYPGAKHNLVSEEVFEAPPAIWEIHGKNGLGEVVIPKSDRVAEDIEAADFLAQAIDEYGDDLTIIATGPLTNLALLEQKYPGKLKEAGNVTIMGGAVGVQGNVSPAAEANIGNDPEAAKIVLEESGAPITLVGLDVTMRVMLNRDKVNEWRKLGEIGEKLADEVNYYIDFYEKSTPGLGGCSLHDPLAVAVAANPELVTTVPLDVVVDTEGEMRGRTIGNVKTLRSSENPINVAMLVDAEKFEKQLNDDIQNIIKEAEAK